ncbi:MAG: hypothetical protein ACFCVA_10435 [Gammaproteobacteria bacterium]
MCRPSNPDRPGARPGHDDEAEAACAGQSVERQRGTNGAIGNADIDDMATGLQAEPVQLVRGELGSDDHCLELRQIGYQRGPVGRVVMQA